MFLFGLIWNWLVKSSCTPYAFPWFYDSKEVEELLPVTYEPWHEISNNVVCATSKGSGQLAHTGSLIRAFASRLNILWLLSYWPTAFGVSKLKKRLHRLVRVYTCQNATLLEITCCGSILICNYLVSFICWVMWSSRLHFCLHTITSPTREATNIEARITIATVNTVSMFTSTFPCYMYVIREIKRIKAGFLDTIFGLSA